MKKLLYIKDVDQQGDDLLSNLSEILANLDSIGKNFNWSIKELEGVGIFELENGLCVSDIRSIARSSENGYRLSWSELRKISTQLTDLINVALVASNNNEFHTPFLQGYNFLNEFPLSIVLLDKNYWEICTEDEEIINRLLKKYHDVEVIDVESLKNEDLKK